MHRDLFGNQQATKIVSSFAAATQTLNSDGYGGIGDIHDPKFHTFGWSVFEPANYAQLPVQGFLLVAPGNDTRPTSVGSTL